MRITLSRRGSLGSRKWVVVFAFGAIATIGCNGGGEDHRDGEIFDAPDAAARVCTSDFATLSQRSPWLGASMSCPMQYEPSPTCGAYGDGRITAGACGTMPALHVDWGTHRMFCYFDPSSRALVGLAYVDDVPAFCNGTSFSEQAGSVPSGCEIASPDASVTCGPGSGTDAGRDH